MHRPGLKSLIICAVFFITTLTSMAQSSLEIKGLVLDKNNAALPAVRIKLYRENKLVSETRSDKDGNYSLLFNSGGPLTLVRYDLTGWHPGKVENISGAKAHLINKILLRPGETLTASERRELGATLSSLLTIDLANGRSVEDFNKEYQIAISALSQRDNNEPEDYVAAFRHFEFLRQEPLTDWHRAGVITSLLAIEKPSIERVNQDSLKISFEAITNSSGWRVWSLPVKEGTKLHLWALGEQTRRFSNLGARYSMSETYANVSEVAQVVIHSASGEIVLNIPTKN